MRPAAGHGSTGSLVDQPRRRRSRSDGRRGTRRRSQRRPGADAAIWRDPCNDGWRRSADEAQATVDRVRQVLTRPSAEAGATRSAAVPMGIRRSADFGVVAGIRGPEDPESGGRHRRNRESVLPPARRSRRRTRHRLDGRNVVNFSSYDYLGLNGHPEVVARGQGRDRPLRYVGLRQPPDRRRAAGPSRPRGRAGGAARRRGRVCFVSGHATNVSVIGGLAGRRRTSSSPTRWSTTASSKARSSRAPSASSARTATSRRSSGRCGSIAAGTGAR